MNIVYYTYLVHFKMKQGYIHNLTLQFYILLKLNRQIFSIVILDTLQIHNAKIVF